MKIIFFRESFLQSVLSDIVTFGFLMFSVWFSVKYCGNSYLLNSVILIMFLFLIIGKGSNKETTFYSTADIREYLDDIDFKGVKATKQPTPRG